MDRRNVSILVVIILVVLGVFLYLNRENINIDVINNGNVEHELIRVTSPQPNATVSSPLTITGEARGNWYFEASFPVKILDANGQMLGQHYAQAEGEWMTTEFVPFTSTLTFSNPTTETGTLVLEKDNPSGLAEHADEIRIPVRFGQVSQSMRTVSLYYYNESKDKDASGNIKCSASGLEAVQRQVPATITPIQDAVKLLIRGELTQAERSGGISTEFPLSGLSLTAASLSNGILTLTFADPQGSTSGGSCRVNILRAQIEATAKQFGGVSQVRFAPVGIFEA